MNRRLLALAVAGAVAPVVALADESSVTIGGRAAVQVDSVSATGATAGSAADIPTKTRVTDIASRVFFKGGEDLGDGLKALFFVQANAPLDGEAGRDKLFCGGGTECYVGLAGGFGEVGLGRRHRPWYISSLGADPWDILTLGSIDAVVYVAPLKIGAGVSGFQAPNSVNWWTPAWNGFRLRTQYAAGENKTATTRSTDEYSFAGTYDVGGLRLGLGYRHVAGAVSGRGQSLGLVASYTIGGGPKLGFIYEDHKANILGPDDLKINDWAVSLAWPFGPHELRANYAKDSGVKGDPTRTADATRSSHWAAGYAYHISKRTELYAQYAKIKNGELVANDFDASVGGVAPGADPKGFALGIIHYF